MRNYCVLLQNEGSPTTSHDSSAGPCCPVSANCRDEKKKPIRVGPLADPSAVISDRDGNLFIFGLVTCQDQFWIQYGAIMDGVSLALFIAAQRFIFEDVVLTGLKG